MKKISFSYKVSHKYTRIKKKQTKKPTPPKKNPKKIKKRKKKVNQKKVWRLYKNIIQEIYYEKK